MAALLYIRLSFNGKVSFTYYRSQSGILLTSSCHQICLGYAVFSVLNGPVTVILYELLLSSLQISFKILIA